MAFSFLSTGGGVNSGGFNVSFVFYVQSITSDLKSIVLWHYTKNSAGAWANFDGLWSINRVG